MIWGLTLEPGKAYTEIIQDELQLSMAILECRKGISENESNFSHIILKTYNAEYLLCTLVNGASYQQTLDLKIMPQEKVTFSVQGSSTVYLVGYSSLCPDTSLDYEMEDVPGWEEDYSREDNEAHYTVQAHKVTDGVVLEDIQGEDEITRSQTIDRLTGDESATSGNMLQETELVYSVEDRIKGEVPSPHVQLAADSLHGETTMSRTEQLQQDGASFESNQTSEISPASSRWSTTTGTPSQSDQLYNPGQSASNPTPSGSSQIYPVGVVGTSHSPTAFQNFQQSPNKRQTVQWFPPSQQTLDTASGSQYPVPLHAGKRTLGSTPSMRAAGPTSAKVRQSLKSVRRRGGSLNKMFTGQHVPLWLVSSQQKNPMSKSHLMPQGNLADEPHVSKQKEPVLEAHVAGQPVSEIVSKKPVHKDWVSVFSIPWEKMPEQLLQNCERKERPLPKYRREMVRIIVLEVAKVTFNPGKKNLDIIAERIINKYPASFRDEYQNRVIGSGHSSLTKQMLNRLEHIRRKAQKETSTSEAEMGLDENEGY